MLPIIIRLSLRLAAVLGIACGSLALGQFHDPRSGYSGPGSGSGGGGGPAEPAIVIEVDTVAELEAAITTAKATGHVTISMKPQNYPITAPLSLTNCHRVTVLGNGSSLSPDLDDPKWANKFLIEMQGADSCTMRELLIQQNHGTLANMPAGGILLGRTATHQTGGRHEFNSVKVQGVYGFAAGVICCSEVNSFTNCFFENLINDPTKPHYGLYITQPKATDSAGGGDGAGPIDARTWSLTGPGLFTSTMSGQLFTNTMITRIWTYAAAPHLQDAVVGLDNSANGSFGNIRFESCWFSGNDPPTTVAANSMLSVIRLFGGDPGGAISFNWALSFDNCNAEITSARSAFYAERVAGTGTVTVSGLRMVNNHWRTSERLIVGGYGTSIEGAVIADEGYNAEADYDWGFAPSMGDDTTNDFGVPSTANGSTRCLIDLFYGGYNFIRLSSSSIALQWDSTAYGIRNGASGPGSGGGSRDAADTRAWSIMRQRAGGSNQSTIAGRYLTDVLPAGIGGSYIDPQDIKSTSAGVFQDMTVGGAPGGASTGKTIVVRRDGIADNSPANIFRVYVPTGNQVAYLNTIVCGHLDNYDHAGTIRGLIVVIREPGANTARSFSTLTAPQFCVGPGGGTDTLTTFIQGDGGLTGAIGAEQYFDVQLRNDISNPAGTWTAHVHVECINANSPQPQGGVRVAALEAAGVDIAAAEALDAGPAPSTQPTKKK